MNRYLLLISFFIIQWPGTTIVSAFFASPAGGMKFSVWVVYLLAIITDVATDTAAYIFGRYVKEWLVSRYPKRISLSPKRFVGVEEYFKAEGFQTMALGKLSHTIGVPVMIAAGSARMKYTTFLAANTFLSVIKSAILVAFGYHYGKHAKVLLHYWGQAGIIFVALLGVLVAYFILMKKRRSFRRRHHLDSLKKDSSQEHLL